MLSEARAPDLRTANALRTLGGWGFAIVMGVPRSLAGWRISMDFYHSEEWMIWGVASGQRLHHELERSTMLLMGKLTISTGPFSIAILT